MKKLKIMVSFLTIIPLLGQEPDSTLQKSPSKAVSRALLFPGGGQFYNDQKIKGIFFLGAALGAGFLYLENANKYKSYDGIDMSEKAKYLKLRNKYGWWVGFIYIYGLLDAIVEAHLHPFTDVMSEDIEKENSEEKEQK
jgi:hypothetical protein|tara:strand:- start:2328 stop:2744 length:417 start_codon:yes stop_codon:yes gene_type:complete